MSHHPWLHRKIEQRLLDARVAIRNGLEVPEILERLGKVGYTEAKLRAGLAIQEEAEALYAEQQKEYGDQFKATIELNNLWYDVNRVYMRTLKLARIAFKGVHDAHVAFDLYGERKKTLTGWRKQAYHFYKNLLEGNGFIDYMVEFGYDKARIESERDLINKVEDAQCAQEREAGEAQKATQKRDARMDELDEWMSDYIAVARIAFEDEPQLLEKLGIIVPS